MKILQSCWNAYLITLEFFLVSIVFINLNIGTPFCQVVIVKATRTTRASPTNVQHVTYSIM
jgi:hypothetical protein